MITEGLLLYLPAATVEALAAESFNQGGIRHWISDVTTSAFSRVLGGGTDTMQANPPRAGFRCSERRTDSRCTSTSRLDDFVARRSYITDVGFVDERLRRTMGGATPPPLPYPPGDPTGVHRFVHD